LSSTPKQFGSRRTGSTYQRRKTPQRGHSHAGSLRTPQSSSEGKRQPLRVGTRPPFLAEMSALKCHIESDDCLLDPRLIDPFFLCDAARRPWRSRVTPPCGLTTSAGAPQSPIYLRKQRLIWLLQRRRVVALTEQPMKYRLPQTAAHC